MYINKNIIILFGVGDNLKLNKLVVAAYLNHMVCMCVGEILADNDFIKSIMSNGKLSWSSSGSDNVPCVLARPT